jgi:hypothetical protein
MRNASIEKKVLWQGRYFSSPLDDEATSGVVTNNYSHLLNSNQLDTDPPGTVARDAAGNCNSDRGGNHTFEYNNAGRVRKVYDGGQLVATYTYNAMGRRNRKVNTSVG